MRHRSSAMAPGEMRAGWGLAIADVCDVTSLKTEGPLMKLGGVVEGADQTSWAAEMEGLRKALVIGRELQTALHVIIDNRVVQEGLRNVLMRTMKLPRYGFRRWMDIAKLLEGMTDKVSWSWVPSHGKREHWQPDVDSHGEANFWRELNRLADTATGDGAEQQWKRYRVEQQAEAWPCVA